MGARGHVIPRQPSNADNPTTFNRLKQIPRLQYRTDIALYPELDQRLGPTLWFTSWADIAQD